MNSLYYGDNLDVLRRYIKDESVDLVYLDPPFNSRREYAVIFTEENGAGAASQEQAFLDSWDWAQAAETYAECREDGGKLGEVLELLHAFLGESDLLAYLVMMAPRLAQLRRVLKPTGSVYLHCDPTASHYLKVLMDSLFGAENFRNEVIWKRTASHNSAKRFGPVHDVILYYGKTTHAKYTQRFQSYSATYLKKFGKVDALTGQRFQDQNLTGPGLRTGPSGQPWRGADPSRKGRHWQPASYLYTKYKELTGVELNTFEFLERLDKLDEAGLIYWTGKANALPRYKQFLEGAAGLPLSDVWTDIDAVNSQADERLGYPTQKPEPLMDRIIEASTKPGDIVLDPFCGCGTTIASADRLERKWLGIDITARAIDIIIQERLGSVDPKSYNVLQYPYSIPDARRLAKDNGFHFQRWALERLGVNPSEIKPGADKGIDGKLYFSDGTSGRTKRVVLSVKGGQRVGSLDVRDLRGVMDRDGFQIGVLVTAVQPSDQALTDMVKGEPLFYQTSDGRRYRRLQHITIEDIFAGKGVDYPAADERKRQGGLRVAAAEPETGETLRLDFDAEPRAEALKQIGKRRKVAKVSLPTFALDPKSAQEPKPSKQSLPLSFKSEARRSSKRGR